MNRSLHSFTAVLALLAFVAGTFAPVALAQDQKPGQEYKFTDAKGDAGPLGGPLGTPVGVPTPATDFADLASMRIYGEDMEGINMDIEVVNLKSFTTIPFGQYVQYDARFTLDGSTVGYQLTVTLNGGQTGTTGVTPVSSRFCITTADRGCNAQRAMVQADWEHNLLLAYIPKASLIGKDGSSNTPPPNMPVVGAGSRLNQFWVQSNANFPTFYGDRMPDSGGRGPYVMGSSVANDRIRIELPGKQNPSNDIQICPPQCGPASGPTFSNDFPEVSVSPGATSLVQLAIKNGNSGKRIINLTAAMVDPKDASKWEVRVVGTLTIPGNDQRIVNLIVNASKTVEHRDSALARVTARSLGFPDEIGAMKVRLLASVPPGPLHKDLYPHAKATTNAGIGGQQLCIGYCFGSAPWMNTIEKDATATADAGIPMYQSSGGVQQSEFSQMFRLDTPLNTDLVLDVNKTITAVLVFKAALPLAATAKMDLFAGDVLVGTGEVPFAGSTSNTPVSFSFLPGLDSRRIHEGTVLALRVALRYPNPQFLGLYETSPSFIPAGSKVSLPAIEDPRPKATANIPLGPAFLTLTAANDTEEFVNPGKVKAFQVTVVNEGIQEDVVKIAANYTPKNWWVDLKPGSSYRLKPGESATFSVLVRSPHGAKEGEQAQIALNATSRADPSALATLSLTAIVTTGVDIQDDNGNATVDPDAESHLEQAPHGKSPGLPFEALLIAIAGVAFIARRRRA